MQHAALAIEYLYNSNETRAGECLIVAENGSKTPFSVSSQQSSIQGEVEEISTEGSAVRIDARYVNNQEMSDVTFCMCDSLKSYLRIALQ